MKKSSVIILLIVVMLAVLLTVNYVQAVKEDNRAYLIIDSNICVIVRSPARQLTTSVGRAGLGITLKDKHTQIFFSGGYIAIAVPIPQVAATISKYHLQKMTIIE